jgi:hypothetical protein
VFVMIGANPCTEAAQGMLALDPAGYLLCGTGAAACETHLAWPLSDREPHLLETVRPGVFAAGDVRAGASNRVAGAVGGRRDGRALRARRARRGLGPNVNGGWVRVGSEPSRRHECQLDGAYRHRGDIRGRVSSRPPYGWLSRHSWASGRSDPPPQCRS